mgnify:CR=1 FL=1|tara:strand:+ start:1093 stop:1599 length:507 start_codon:yes stop_codon:yes gene_type:complete
MSMHPHFPSPTDVLHTEESDCGDLHYITPQSCWDLLVSAFEGGSNYWVDYIELPGDTKKERAAWHEKHSQRAQGVVNNEVTSELRYCINTSTYRWAHQIPFIYPGSYLKIFTDDDSAPHILGMDAIMQGITHMMETPKLKREWLGNNHDAITADCFLQYCLFDEVVYG